MVQTKPKKDRDEITIAKSIFDEIVEFSEEPPDTPKKKRAKKGGEARASNLTPEKRAEIARNAANKRWSDKQTP